VTDIANAQLRLDEVSHAYEQARKGKALNAASFTVPAGELWTLLGPSGSGKSTLLGIIGGYVRPSAGRVLLNGLDITRLPPMRRDMGMVFQDYALFPHMSVFENIAYGLRARRLDNAEVRSRVGEIIGINRLNGFEQRYPAQLSGGQQQRVALARALVIRPSVLLMDEALGALDLKLRESMQIEVRKIQRALATTTIHVTHDQTEALTMSDRIIVLNAGNIEQIGTPEELRLQPANRFVADFVGANNVLAVGITSSSCGETGGVTRGAILGVEGEHALCSQPCPPGWESGAYLVLRPEDIRISSSDLSPGIAGRVIAIKYVGTSRCLVLEIGPSVEVVAFDPTAGDATVGARIGDRLRLGWSAECAFLVTESAAATPAPRQPLTTARAAAG